MLKVTIDLFSGRPNPTWIVTSEAVAKKVIAGISANSALAGDPETGWKGLGYRGVEVELLGDDNDAPKKLPRHFLLAGHPGPSLRAGKKLAETLIKDMLEHAKIELPDHVLTPLTPAVRDYALESLSDFIKNPPTIIKPPKLRSALRRTIGDAKCDKCQYEISVFNPNFWNSNSAVRTKNNCYNYARNWRTNTYAQPGRASGHPTSVMSCPTVSNAARSDGLVDRCKCLPQSEYPRRLMALVIAPNLDYHWYRHQAGGFWGHKPGQTAARNIDNNGVIITNPETCARGPYTQFCGYFYAGKSVVIA